MLNWLEKIRKSDNTTKFRYVVLFTGLVGVLVVALWATSLRGIIESATAPQAAEQPKASLYQRFAWAWQGLTDRTKKTFEFFREKAGQTNEIIIEKP